jgi:peptidylprolyl isomerase
MVLRSARRLAAWALVGVTLLVVAGCGGSSSQPEPPAVPSSVSPTRPPDPGPVKITVNNATNINLRPNLVVNRGALPTQLETKDLIVGKGRTAAATDTVTVQYVGVIARNGQEFDASWDKGQPATFSLAEVIPGFRNGIAGMKEGGRRQIFMPPDQAYGPAGAGTVIGPNESLIFIVDLIKID